jgi:cell division septation protein DedD
MRGVFDEQQLEPVRQSRDTELTLGTGALLAILCGLILLCALFFGLGYSAGHRTPVVSSSTAAQPATDQEPLQASGNVPKPSAVAQVPVAPPSDYTDAANQPAAATDSTPNATSGPGATVQTSGEPTDVHPALPVAGVPQNPMNSGAQTVHPAFSESSAQTQPGGQQFMVQIAAVSNPQDAEALVNALKKRAYPASTKREPADNLLHVRIGPFASRQLADQWRMKLLNDGYNAQVQP